MNCGIDLRHYCGKSGCDTNVSVGKDSEFWCDAPHPDTVYNEDVDADIPIARCRLLTKGHDGPHRAHIFNITSLAEWS